jgi:proline iminopeptidase
VIVPDQRGHGRSDAGPPDSWNLPTWATDIHALCEVLGVERPVLLGMSFGGFVAQQYAFSYPEDIAGLILISTCARFPSSDETIARVREVGGDKAADAVRRDIENPTTESSAEVARVHRSLYSRHATPDPLTAAIEPHIMRTSDVIERWWPEAQRTMDLRPQLANVRCPTVVLIGEHDPLNPPGSGTEIVAAIPDGRARLEIIPDAAHRVFGDNPEHAYSCIRQFLAVLG